MFIALTILTELLFVAALILICFRVKSRYGYVLLYVLLGSFQYFQTIVATTTKIKILGSLSVSAGTSIIFSAGLFAILLMYIKEGVKSSQRLILAIVLANFSFTILSIITNQQELATKGSDSVLFVLNFRVFIVGTITLILDAFLLIILYEFFFVRVKWLNLYTRLVLAMLITLNFDAVLFVTGSFWGNPEIGNKMLGQIVGKSVTSVFFGSMLFLYLRYFDNEKELIDDPVQKGKEDIFSILTYKGRYEKLKFDKASSDEKLKKVIEDKTGELEKSIKRFIILSEIRELRIDKFSIADQAKEILVNVKEAFEVDACTIHQIKNGKLELLASIGVDQEEAEKILPLSSPYLNEIIVKRKSLAIEDVRVDTKYSGSTILRNSAFQYISCLGTPMLSGKEVAGILKIYVVKEKRIFTNLEIEHLHLVASQIAHIQENTMLFEQNEKHKEILVKQIVARRKVEEAIKDSEEKYRNLIDQASDPIIVYNDLGLIITCNEAACKLTGYSKDEFLALDLTDFFFKEDLKNFPFQFDSIKEGKSTIAERVLKCKDGSSVNIEINSRLMPDGTTMVVVRDLTERKKAEQEKQSLLLRNQQTISTMLDGFILADEKGKIIEVNPSYCTMTGYTNEELLQKNINELESSLLPEEVERRIKEMLEKKSIQFETKHRRKDNILIELEVSISIMEFDQRALVAAFVREITERKKAQAQITLYNTQLRDLAAHLLKIREEERRRIGREIHDDLGQQLTAIKMDVAWIDKKIENDNFPIKEKLKNIIGLLDGSNQSVRRILNELKPSILDEYGLLDALEWHAKQFTGTTGIPVTIDTAESEIRLEEEAATCIFRVCQEALTNIARHSGAQKVLLSLVIEDENIIVKIEDDGDGFKQEEAQNKGSFGVIGMNERVRSLGGVFDIQSTIDKGTTIIFSLPFRETNDKI